jgi:hypothetical protein
MSSLKSLQGELFENPKYGSPPFEIKDSNKNTVQENSDKGKVVRFIQYPIDVKRYRGYWGPWDILREFTSNALDAENGDWNKVVIGTTPDGNEIFIHNKTRSLDIRDFYFGYSSQGKDIDSDFIGRFNEGMKLAMCTALRNNYRVRIYFKNYVAEAKTVDTEDGITTMCVEVKERREEIPGTKVVIEGIKEAEKIIKDNVIMPNDSRIVYEVKDTRDSGIFKYSVQVINENKLFVGGMFVEELKDSSWGYNFNPSLIKLSEGRNIADLDSVKNALSDLMLKIDNIEYWKKIFENIRDKKDTFEKGVWVSCISDDSIRESIKKAFHEVFGKDAVVGSLSYRASKEAEYRGATVIEWNKLLGSLSELKILPSCEEFIERYSSANREIYDWDKLSKKERLICNKILEIIRYHLPSYELVIYEPKDPINEDENGYTDHTFKTIGIRRSILNYPDEVIKVLLEELTHAIFYTDDTSRDHADGIRELASRWLMNDSMQEKIRELKQIYKKTNLSLKLIFKNFLKRLIYIQKDLSNH